jgi:Ala-tRNA(Pro) deacylase
MTLEEHQMSHAVEHHGFEAVAAFLDARGLGHAVVEHAQTFTAHADAHIAAVAPEHTAKAVMVRDDAGYVMAIVPASELLDIRKLRHLTHRPRLRLATEGELAGAFPQFELGALPPFGELFDCPEYIDRRLLATPRVLCNGGDHRHSVVLNSGELRYASGAIAADLVAARASSTSAVAPGAW